MKEETKLVGIHVSPKVSKVDKQKLRPNPKKPKEGLLLKPGKTTIEVRLGDGKKPRLANEIIEVGMNLPEKKGTKPISNYFHSIRVTIRRLGKPTGKKPRTVKESVVKVPVKSINVKQLKDILDKAERDVTKVTFELVAKKPVKVTLNVKGCFEKRTTTTTRRIPTSTGNPSFSLVSSRSSAPVSTSLSSHPLIRHNCSLEGLVGHRIASFEMHLVVVLDMCLKNGLFPRLPHSRFGLFLPSGISLVRLEMHQPSNRNFFNHFSYIGILLPGKAKDDLLGRYFYSLNVRVVSTEVKPNGKLSTTSRSVSAPVNQTNISNLKKFISSNISSVKFVEFSFDLKIPVEVFFNFHGCMKPKRRSTLSTSSSVIKQQEYHCTTIFNLIKNEESTLIRSNPELTSSEIKNMRFDSRTPTVGTELVTGSYDIVVDMLNNRMITLVEFGIVLSAKSPNLKSEKTISNIIVTVTKMRMRFGKWVGVPIVVDVQKDATFGDLRNVLSSDFVSVSKVSVQFSLLKKSRVALILKGCQMPVLSTTTIKGSSGPSSGLTTAAVLDQQYRCTTVYNLIISEQSTLIQSNPELTSSEIKNLRFDSRTPTVGTELVTGNYDIEVDLLNNQMITLVEFGIVFSAKSQSLKSEKTISNIIVTVTKMRMRFGKWVGVPIVVDVQKDATFGDLRNVLSSDFVSVSKVSVQFSLLKKSRVALILKGCQMPVLSTTTIKGSSGPSSGLTTAAVLDQEYRCTTVNNLISDERMTSIQTLPVISQMDILKLRFISKNPFVGTLFHSGTYKIDVNLPSSQLVIITQFGLIFVGAPSNSLSDDLVTNISVSLTKMNSFFGSRIINLPPSSSASIQQLRNLLPSQYTQITKVTIKFTLLKTVKVALLLNGCSAPNITLLTTIPPSVPCNNSLNLLDSNQPITIDSQPPVPPSELSLIKYIPDSPSPGTTHIVGNHLISVLLSPTTTATVTDLGLLFPSESNSSLSSAVLSYISVTVLIVEKAYGRLFSNTSSFNISTLRPILSLQKMISSPISNVNGVKINLGLVKETKIQVKFFGCLSSSSISTTTQPFIGCLHLSKFYNHGDIINGTSSCMNSVCLDGTIVNIVTCNGKWTAWKTCSKPCGSGQTSRRKICTINPNLNSNILKNIMNSVNISCLGETEVMPCFEKPCTPSCKMSEWSDWSTCNNGTCATEYQLRTRTVVSNPNNIKCSEPLVESKICVKSNCPCQENAEYNDCANIVCPTSCDHLDSRVKCVPTNSVCVKGCLCKFGYMYQNGKCVPKSNCTCLKPDFKGLPLTSTSPSQMLHTTTALSSTGNQDSGQSNNLGNIVTAPSTQAQSIQTTSVVQLKTLTKEELAILRKQYQVTPPWLPGETPPQRYDATLPWYPGATDPGATVRITTNPPRMTMATPPSGLTAAPPNSWLNNDATKAFIVTSRYIPQNVPIDSNSPGSQPQPPPGQGQQGSINVPTPISSIQSNTVAPGSGSPSEPSDNGNNVPQSGSIPPGTSAELQPNKTSSPDINHINANSTVLSDCQTCICTNGQLICNGPKCQGGQNTWSDWSEWSPCATTCGIGIRRRYRYCQGSQCIDQTTSLPGITRTVLSNGLQAEDKSCAVLNCSCIFSRDLLKMLIGNDNIKKNNIDMKVVWIEKDNIKGPTHNKELVHSGDIILSGQTIRTNCAHCDCSNGNLSCLLDCK